MPGPPSRTRVLIADENRIIADMLAIILAGKGFETRAVYSGHEAVTASADFKPEVFLSDFAMAPINGIEAAIYISGSFPECRVLLISGHPTVQDQALAARDQGHTFAVLRKPVHPEAILEWMAAAGVEMPVESGPRSTAPANALSTGT